MAKKAKKAKSAKSRLTAAERRVRDRPHEKPIPVTIVPPEGENSIAPILGDPPVGTVTVATVVDMPMLFVSPARGIRISLDHIGIGADVDSVTETSGNHRYLDGARPPVVDGPDLLVFFDPELSVGQWNFQFRFQWTEEMETVVPNPLEDGKYAGVVENKPAKTRAAKAKKAKGKK